MTTEASTVTQALAFYIAGSIDRALPAEILAVLDTSPSGAALPGDGRAA